MDPIIEKYKHLEDLDFRGHVSGEEKIERFESYKELYSIEKFQTKLREIIKKVKVNQGR